MPIIREEHTTGGATIAIWEISEPESLLLSLLDPDERELQHLNKIKAPQRRLHWLAARVLAARYLPDAREIVYSSSGQPNIPGSAFNLSIAHSASYAALLIDNKPAGIDLELISPRIRKVMSRFMHPDELVHAALSGRDDTLYIYWCAKEAVVKWLGDPTIDFQNMIRINPFTLHEKGEIETSVKIVRDTISIPMIYEKIGQYMVVYTI